APPAGATTYTVTLTASKAVAQPNESVTLTATVSPTLAPGDLVAIVEQTTNTGVQDCTSGSTCTVAVSHLTGTFSYQACVNGCGLSTMRSSVVTVTWGPIVDPAGTPSQRCSGGLSLLDSTVEGVAVKVYALTTATETDL